MLQGAFSMTSKSKKSDCLSVKSNQYFTDRTDKSLRLKIAAFKKCSITRNGKICISGLTKIFQPKVAGARIPCNIHNPWTSRFKRQAQDSPCGGGWWPSPSPQQWGGYYPQQQYLPWDTAAYYGWSYPQQPYPQQWPGVDPLQPDTSDLTPAYAPQPQDPWYPDYQEAWYPPQARPSYDDYYNCGDCGNCYGSCGDYPGKTCVCYNCYIFTHFLLLKHSTGLCVPQSLHP